MKLGDRICLLNDGRVEQIDTPEGFQEHPKNQFVREFMGDHLHKDINNSKISDLNLTRTLTEYDEKQGYPIIKDSMKLQDIYEILAKHEAVIVENNHALTQSLLRREDVLTIYLKMIRRVKSMNEFLTTLNDRRGELLRTIFEHIQISFIALFIAILIAVPLGIALTKTKRLSEVVMNIAAVLQTIPSLALLGLMIPIFGIGKVPAIIALVVYALLPILRNTYTGIKSRAFSNRSSQRYRYETNATFN